MALAQFPELHADLPTGTDLAETLSVDKWEPQIPLNDEVDGPFLPGVPKTDDVCDQEERRFLSHDEAASFIASIGVPMVETLERGDAFSHDQTSLLALAEGHYTGTQNEREGIVIRPQTETISPPLGGRLSFKAISNRFLLRGGE